jgi:protein involved in polysaccharide export with SLBB domain
VRTLGSRKQVLSWLFFLLLAGCAMGTGAFAFTNSSLYPSSAEDQQAPAFGAPDQKYPSNLLRSPQLPPRFPAEPGGYPTPYDQRLYRTMPPPHEKPSDYELFVSEKVEITETQLEVLKNFQGISFTISPRPLPPGIISIPVRIVAPPDKEMKKEKQEKPDTQDALEKREKPREAMQRETKGPMREGDAGYLEGSLDTIAAAFRLLGIRSPYAISTDLKQFGYDLFQQPAYLFAPGDRVPVGPDYVLGPGDEIRITVWGRVEGVWNVIVDRDGTIALPKIGVVGVTGLTFQELKTLLHKEVSKYYSGFDMNVSLGRLRSIKVYLVGNAQRPGAYTISSLSTLVNALFEGGGPNKNGSMRDIQLKRNGETVVHFDLYDFLLKGDKRGDVRLMPEDVVFIPPVGPLAAVAGNVNAPAVYELKDEKTVAQLIEMAGGLNTIAFQGRIQVERIVENRRQTVFESDWETVRKEEVPLERGDIVKVFQVVQDRRVVKISGAIQREGEYGFRQGMSVKDLVSMAGGVKYYAYDKGAELTRLTITEKGPVTTKIIIDMEKAMQEDAMENIPLQENDYLFIRTVPEWKLYNIVKVTGEVKFPGAYTIARGERLSSLIERVGGYTNKAYLKGAVFTRETVKETQQKRIDEMVTRLERELLVQSVSSVSAASSPEEARIKEVESKQSRELIEKLRTVKASGRMVIALDQLAELKKSPSDIELEEGDSLHIPSDPQSVQIIGAVYNQTAFVYTKGKNIESYVNLAGGYTDSADRSKLYVFKADGSAVKPGSGGMFLFGGGAYGGGKSLESGDTIVVPEKLERIAWLREFKDITQILYQIAVGAGVIFVAF